MAEVEDGGVGVLGEGERGAEVCGVRLEEGAGGGVLVVQVAGVALSLIQLANPRTVRENEWCDEKDERRKRVTSDRAEIRVWWARCAILADASLHHHGRR